MSQSLPVLYLVRHGETAWTLSRQHTGLTDIPLTERGERDALRLGEHLRGVTLTRTYTSPLQRARRTCELAGFGAAAVVDPDLVEWDYGAFEGLTGAQVRDRQPGWNLWRDGCPSGESVATVGARADRVIARVRALDRDAGVFSSGHFSRALAARWLGLDASFGRYFALNTATLSILGYEHDMSEPVVKLWNDAKPGLD